MIQAHQALFTKLVAYPSPSAIPPKLVDQAIAAAGGGAKGLAILTTINANRAAIEGVIAVAPVLETLKPYAAQLTALSKVPPQVFSYLQAHGAAVQKAAATAAGPVEDVVLGVLRRDHVLPAEHPAAARPLEPGRRPAATRRSTRR